MGSESIRTVLVSRRHAALDCLRKRSAVPCEGVGAAVVIRERVADGVTLEVYVVERGQLVNPLRIGVGISITRKYFIGIIVHVLNGKNIAVRIVSEIISKIAFKNADKLILYVVGVINRRMAVR